jgi:glycine cleavage system H protein
MATIGIYTLPDNLYYDGDNHLWLQKDDRGITLGLDMLGQASMGDMAYVSLEASGKQIQRGESLGSLEAAKMVAPILSPISGTIVKKNDAVERRPRILNESPYDRGWLVVVEPSNWDKESEHLLTGAKEVQSFLAGELKRYRDKGWID